ncbi:MAG: rhodanese-like domain-containing protein [Oscillospiraceae bacterium]|nr:rhodanese-like domain-containing protein [Oscillospiraceae bacterium]
MKRILLILLSAIILLSGCRTTKAPESVSGAANGPSTTNPAYDDDTSPATNPAPDDTSPVANLTPDESTTAHTVTDSTDESTTAPTTTDNTDEGGDDEMSYSTITAQEAKQIIDGDEEYILLDVRTEAEYLQQRIDGAILIPHTEINTAAPDKLPDKDMIIIVYCRSGARSAAASKALAQMGYTRVYDFGGIIYWPYDTISGNSADK